MTRSLVIVLAALLVVFIAPSPLHAQPAASASSRADSQAAAATGDPVDQAEQLFEAGDYAAGRKLLNDACRKARRSHEEYARLVLALISFYERFVGDYRFVRSYVREIQRLKLPQDHPHVVAARQIQRELDAMAAEYRAEEELLAQVRVFKKDEDVLERRVVELTALIERSPDYPRLAVAYHYLGESHLYLKQYRKAYRAFERAIELRPAIMFAVPTAERKERAFDAWVRHDLSVGAWIVLGAVLLLAVLLFYLSKPWRYLGIKHALVLVLLVAAWGGFFKLSLAVLQSTVSPDLRSFPSPVYVHTDWSSPMAGVLDQLFLYGLVGVCGAFVIAVSTARFKPRWTWAFINSSVVLMLFVSLMTQFALRHGAVPFEPAEEGRYPFLRGTFQYPMSNDLDPFILTEPKRYCQFQKTINDMDEDETKDWFRKYARICPEQ